MPDDRFNEYCENLLAQYKRRNTKAVARHIRGVCDILRHEDDLVVQTKFGGSVQKNTYVTGLSDVDILLMVDQSPLKNKPPSTVIGYVRDTIKRRLPKNRVSKGKLAVTINFADKTELQVLPALRTTDGFRIADPGTTRWSNVIHPERFVHRLISVNNARGGRVVPIIKLAKAMADCSIPNKDSRITGYHMETLAIGAFRGNQGKLDSKSMLLHFLEYAENAVMRPIADRTGQSRHVDDYLGQAGSRLRKGASTHFGQMRGKVRRCTTRRQFNDLFCIGN